MTNPTASILLIEDDTDINNLMAEALSQAGYRCTQAFSGTEGLLDLDRGPYSLVILDLMLPGRNGEELLPQIKAKTGAPVLVVSAKDSLDSKVGLLTAGAEDYLTKPFAIQELVARAEVQLRRFARPAAGTERVLRHRDLVLSPDTFSVTVAGQPVDLTRQEFKILELLLSHPGRVFSKQAIYDYAWEDLYLGEDKTVNVHISNIRKKLRAVSPASYIDTVWGVGFRLAP